jgi:hypothetical protein
MPRLSFQQSSAAMFCRINCLRSSHKKHSDAASTSEEAVQKDQKLLPQRPNKSV